MRKVFLVDATQIQPNDLFKVGHRWEEVYHLEFLGNTVLVNKYVYGPIDQVEVARYDTI